jgi:hypothetical protein
MSAAEIGLKLGVSKHAVIGTLRANDDETPDPREFRLEGAEG